MLLPQRHICRILQEGGLINARRHGEPGATTIELQPYVHELHLRMTNPSQKTRLSEGNGLHGIREMDRLCRGKMAFHTSNDSFILEITFPSRLQTAVLHVYSEQRLHDHRRHR